jgi:hypothetical protein
VKNPHACPVQVSDIGQFAEVLAVFGVAAFALLDRFDSCDKLDCLDPLDHLKTELILDAQACCQSALITGSPADWMKAGNP